MNGTSLQADFQAMLLGRSIANVETALDIAYTDLSTTWQISMNDRSLDCTNLNFTAGNGDNYGGDDDDAGDGNVTTPAPTVPTHKVNEITNTGDTSPKTETSSFEPTKGKRAGKVAGVAVGLTCIVALLAAVIVVHTKRQRRNKNTVQVDLFKAVADNALNQFARNYRHIRQSSTVAAATTIAEISVPRKSVQVHRQQQLGDGRRTTVYAGTLRTDNQVIQVAVKEFRMYGTSTLCFC
jgi:hypothetical protein